MGFFRHLPTTSETDMTANLEQLEQLIEKLRSIPTPAETTGGNTKALTEILAVLRAG